MKFFTSDMIGAPVLSGTAGAMLSVLDACLKDGFGIKSATSGSVSGGVATLNFTGGTAAVPGSTISVSGITDKTDMNGEHVVLTASSTQVTYATSATDGSAAGTITFKMAPLGWTKAFSGTNLAAYRPSVPEATGCYLRVDDTGTNTCRVLGYESMTDVATGQGPFPTDSQFSGGMHWPKSMSADSGARQWGVFGDAQFFLVYVKSSDNVSYQAFGGTAFGFGDLVPLKSGDAYACVLFGGNSDVSFTGGYPVGNLGYAEGPSGTSIEGFVARSSTGIGGSQPARKMSAYLNTQSGLGNNTYLSFPNLADNGLLIAPVDVRVGASIRGRLPGVYHTPQFIADAMSNLSTVEGTGPFAGKKMLVLRLGTTGSSAVGPTFIDITGPWR